MRDFALVAMFVPALLMAFKEAVWAAYLWAWFSLMSPHRLTYGFAYSLPFAYVIAFVAIAVWLGRPSQRQKLPVNGITLLWFLLFSWMSLTSLFAINAFDLVYDRWVFVLKIHLMLLVSLMLVTKPEHLKMLVIIVTLSVAFYGIKGGAFTVTTGGSYRVWGPSGSLLQGNNELAVGLVIVTPFLYWMRQTTPNVWIRRALTVSIALCVFSVLGTQSRGALLAIVAMSFFLGLKSNHPIRLSLLLLLAVAAAVAFMPSAWSDRMDTISTYREDSSAMQRIWTWTTLWNVAVDRPLVGAGFRADSRTVFAMYAPAGGEFAAFEGLIFVAHSIYFQMLGEHGFVGLGIFLALWATVWISAGKVGRQAAGKAMLQPWLPLLMRMTQVSLIGYLVGGAFLSLAYLDLPYYIMGFVIVGQVLVARSMREVEATRESGSAGRANVALAQRTTR